MDGNGSMGKPHVPLAPVQMITEVGAVPSPKPFVVLDVQTAEGTRRYWYEPEMAEKVGEAMKVAAQRARTGLILPNQG